MACGLRPVGGAIRNALDETTISLRFGRAAKLQSSAQPQWDKHAIPESPESLCNLAFSVWNLRLPQFDRISLRVTQACEPAVGIRLRVNLDRDSRSL